jgi:hypothetical protein
MPVGGGEGYGGKTSVAYPHPAGSGPFLPDPDLNTGMFAPDPALYHYLPMNKVSPSLPIP